MNLRVRFTKLGKVRWTSHRDVARMWERALRRAGLPVSYSCGFSPRPKLSFGLALPTGCESVAEYLDVALAADVDPQGVAETVGPLLPLGVEVAAVGELEAGVGSLQELVTSCTWEICVPGVTRSQLDTAVAAVMEAEHLPVKRERKGRTVTDDMRPSLLTLASGALSHETFVDEEEKFLHQTADAHPADLDNDEHGSKLYAELGTRPRGVRPVELAEVLGVELGLSRRTCQWIEGDGSKFEPLEIPVAVAAAVSERAS